MTFSWSNATVGSRFLHLPNLAEIDLRESGVTELSINSAGELEDHRSLFPLQPTNRAAGHPEQRLTSESLTNFFSKELSEWAISNSRTKSLSVK
jgi:hypothetical protein